MLWPAGQTRCRVAVTGLALLGNDACCSGHAGFPAEHWFFCDKSPDQRRNPALPQSAMPVMRRVLVPEVLPAVMPDRPEVPEFLPAAPSEPVLPSRVPAGLPADGRAALAAALAGPVPGAQRKTRGKTLLPDDITPLTWDDNEMSRFLGFLRSMSDRRDPRGRRLPLDYLVAVAVAAGAAGDDSPEAAAAWAAAAPARILHRLGAPRDAAGKPPPPGRRDLLPGPRRPGPCPAGR
jgi:hypothetical protein